MYINSFAVPVDLVLSQAAEQTIAKRGPLTQDFRRVLPLLQPEASEAFSLDLFAEFATMLQWVYEDQSGSPSTWDIMLILLGKPS